MRRDRSGLAFQLKWLGRLGGNVVTYQRKRCRPQEDLVPGSDLLEPRRDAHRIYDDERLTRGRIAGDPLTGVRADPRAQADAELHLELDVQGLKLLAHRLSCTNRAERIV